MKKRFCSGRINVDVRTILAFILVFIVNLTILLPAQSTITVGQGGGYDYSTITAALQAAQSGAVILVAGGEYSASTGETFPLQMKENVILKRENDQVLPVIRGDGVHGVIQCINIHNPQGAVIEGFHITGGKTETDVGGGIYCWYASVTIIDCIISHNEALGGGGVMFYGGSPRLIRCQVKYNNTYGGYGGGVRCSFSDAFIYNCVIRDNGTSGKGGGVYCIDNAPTIMNCTIVENVAEGGGSGVYCWLGTRARFMNCIMYINGPSWNPLGDSFVYEQCNPVVTWCDVQGGFEGEGNIDQDPGVDTDDYILMPGSPCIDAGNPAAEYNDACLPPGLGGVRNDMGAYGGPYNCGPVYIRQPYLALLTEYGDIWGAANYGSPPFANPYKRGTPGFQYDPANGYYLLTGNADGTGFKDMIQVTPSGEVWVSLSQNDLLQNPARWGTLGFQYREEDETNGDIPLCGDADGDGVDDIIQVTQFTDVWVSLSTETSYDAPSRWGWTGFSFRRGTETEDGAIPLAGDFNADQLCDILQITQHGDAWVALSDGSQYQDPVRWGWTGFLFSPGKGDYPMVADADGDGLDDMIQVTKHGDLWVALSTGTSFENPTRWGWLGFIYDEDNDYYTFPADLNNDEKADIIQITPEGVPWVSLSAGDTYSDPEPWGNLDFIWDRNKKYWCTYID